MFTEIYQNKTVHFTQKIVTFWASQNALEFKIVQ